MKIHTEKIVCRIRRKICSKKENTWHIILFMVAHCVYVCIDENDKN